MVHKDDLCKKIVEFLNTRLESIYKENSMLKVFMKPIITRSIANNMGKVHKSLGMIADENGMVDVDGILNEMMTNLCAAPVEELGIAKFGRGKIEIALPFTNHCICLDKTDIEDLKKSLNEHIARK